MDKHDSDLLLLLGRLDGKMDTLIAQQATHDTRIRDLERSKWVTQGFAAAVSGIVTFAIHLIGVLPK